MDTILHGLYFRINLRPLHNRKNFAVATEKIFQVTLVARHFNKKWSFFLFLGEFPHGQVKPDNPVKQLFLHFRFLPHIDLGSCTPSMSAVDECYKTWKCTATHLAELRNEFDNGASGLAPV